VQASVTVTHTV